MRLKKIYLRGFKSIADPLELEFGWGVTCIVGPNGCGKSNVVDAVKWVLGDQNPRNLRANRMQDLIFNGTNSRNPEAMAEVRLLIENEDGLLPIPYSEVEVGRRLYRSGESEYRINKELVRLKDITDLFSNTGIGTTSYSLLEQGKVDAILNSKPSERRAIFEEAAEITKYRLRQDEAIRKLKRTDQDLQRIDDIVGELERQVRSLKYQANKASRYNKLHLRLHNLELIRLARRRILLEEEDSARKAAETQATEMKANLERQIRDGENGLRAARESVEQVKKQLSEVEAERARLQSEIKRLDDQLAHNRQMETELRGQEKRTAELARTLREEFESLRVRSEESEQSLVRLQKELEDLEREESFFASQEKEGVEEFEKARNAAREAVEKGTASERALERLLIERENIEKELANLEDQEEKIRSEIQQADQELKEIDGRFTTGRSLHEQAQATLRSEEEIRNRLRGRIENLDREISAAVEKCEALQLERSQMRHRLESLQELQDQHEGHGEGIKQVLEKRNDAVSPFDRIQGLLIERIQVTPGYEDALESALSLWFNSLLCDTQQTAEEVLKALRESSGGRVTCLPLEVLRNRGGAASSSPTGEVPSWAVGDGFRTALEVATVPEEDLVFFKPVLKKTLIVPDLESLSRILDQMEEGWIVVTREGEVAVYPGLISGGKTVSTGFLRRQSEIERIRQNLETLEVQCGERETALEHLRHQRKNLGEEVRGHEETIHDLVIRIAARQEELQGLAKLREKVENNRHRLQDSLEWLSTDRENLREKKVETEKQIQVSNDEVETHRAEAALKKEECRRVEEALRDLRSKHARHREKLVALKKDWERTQGEIQHLKERRNQIEERLDDLEKENRERAVKLEECSRQGKEAEQALKELFEKIDTIEKDVSALEAEVTHQEEKYALREEQVRQVREMHEVQVEKLRSLQMEAHRAEIERENLERRLREELQSDWEEAEEAVRTTEDVPEDLEELKQNITDLRERIGRMGEVNPLALEEFNEQNERLQFLLEQKGDLEKAKASLQRTISEVKRSARKIFLEVFEEIRQNFNRTFRKIFGGGRADLLLLDEADVLETGIEIVAQPPGKKLQSITLFSGGEKSMTAIALLFAVYQVKASPFCFLDEVDAALDDANVDRLARLLTDYRKKSQFIIITHNKHTMAAADRLYGVTMEKPGISTVMAMEFESRSEYNLDPLPEPEEDPLPPRDYNAALGEDESGEGSAKAPVSEAEPEEVSSISSR